MRVPAGTAAETGAADAGFTANSTARTASSIVPRFATRRTAAGRSTTYASGLVVAYASTRASHSFLCGDDAGIFWSTTSKGWPA